jgi:hypothetical protein
METIAFLTLGNSFVFLVTIKVREKKLSLNIFVVTDRSLHILISPGPRNYKSGSRSYTLVRYNREAVTIPT